MCLRVSVFESARGGGVDKGDEKERNTPRIQDVKAPTEWRALIGCLEKTASGAGISMHEICRQSEKERVLRERSTVKCSGSCPPHFDFHNTCSLTGTRIANFLNSTCRQQLSSLWVQKCFGSFNTTGPQKLCHKPTNKIKCCMFCFLSFL